MGLHQASPVRVRLVHSAGCHSDHTVALVKLVEDFPKLFLLVKWDGVGLERYPLRYPTGESVKIYVL